MAAYTVLNLASAARSSSTSGALNSTVGTLRELSVTINVTAFAGTNPTVQFYLDTQGADGVWYTLWQSALVSAAQQVITSLGAGLATTHAFGATVRLGWTVGGSGAPTATFSASIIGK